MQKYLVPTAPVPSWTSAANNKPSSSGRSFHPASSQLPPLDAGFLRGIYSALLKLGVALTFVVFALSQSIQITWSFAAGVLIAGSLLKAQEYFAARLFAARNHNKMTQPNGLLARIAGRFPLWLIVALKYAGVIFTMWFLLRFANMSPLAFVLGFLVLKVVIIGSVIGRMFKARSIREVYIRPHNCHLS